MAHAVWKGSIQFGLVNIPVGLYTAESPDDLDLDLIDRRSMAPVGYKRVNKETGREVPYEEIVKGYEVSEGRYVVVEDKDLKRASPEATQTIDIVGFVEADAIAPIYFDKPYYLAPVGQGGKAYALLREALEKSGRLAIARLVVRTRQYVAAVYPMDDVLVVQVLRYRHELRDAGDLDLPKGNAGKPSSREVEMAERLIEGMAEEWKPASYKDEYRDQLLALIKKKAKAGEDVEVEEVEEEEKPREAEIVDLMALLKESVSKGKGKAKDKSAAKGKSEGKAARGKGTKAPARRRSA